MHAVQVVAMGLLMASMAACSGVRQTEGSTQEPYPTTVEVRNLKPIDFTVYVLTGTHRLRLGTVTGMTTRTFVIPPHVLFNETSRMRFGLDTVGAFARNGTGAFWTDGQTLPNTPAFGTGGRFTSTETPAVRAGDQLSLTIQNLDQLAPVIQQPIDPGPGEAAMEAPVTRQGARGNLEL